MKKRKTIWRFVRGALIRLILYPALLLTLLVLYLCTVGFPAWLLREVQGRIPMRSFVVEAEAAKMDLLHGLILEDVKLYRKRVVGPPAVEASRVVLGIHPFARPESRLDRIVISRGVFQPAMLLAADKVQEPGTVEAPRRLAVELDQCAMYGVEIEKLTFSLRIDESGLTCNNMAGVLRSGASEGGFNGTVYYDTRKHLCRGHVQTAVDLHLLIPILEEWHIPVAVQLINRFDFADSPPRCEVDFQRSYAADPSFRMDTSFVFENGTYRDIPLMKADGRVRLDFSHTNGLVIVNPLTLVRKDGAAKGSFSVDTRAGVVAFEGEANTDPKALARMVGIFTNGIMDSWRFEGPRNIVAKGHSSYLNYSNVDIEVAFEGRNTGIGPLFAQDCAFTLQMLGNTGTVSDIRGRMYEGELNGSAMFVVPAEATQAVAYAVTAKLQDANMAKFMKAVTAGNQEHTGQLSGRLSVKGWLGKEHLASTSGEGAVKIREGKVFMMPVFGGLSSLMARIVPGLDFVMRQSDASAEFTMTNGIARTDKILIEGDVLSLSGHGDYELASGKLDFNVQVKLMKEHTLVAKVLGVITYPLSKLFEFRVRGTLAEPNWYPENFSKDLLEKIGLRKEKEDS